MFKGCNLRGYTKLKSFQFLMFSICGLLLAMNLNVKVYAREELVGTTGPAIKASMTTESEIKATVTRTYLQEQRFINFDNNNVVDWIHMNQLSPNVKVGTLPEDKIEVKHYGTKSGFEQKVGDGGMCSITYSNGQNQMSATDSTKFNQFTGKDSYFEVTAPSKVGVERKLSIYMGSWAAKEISVEATLGGINIPVENFSMDSKSTLWAKYTISYTGISENEKLIIRFTLTDNSLDPTWNSVLLAAVEMTEGEVVAEKTIRFNGPSLTGVDAVKAPASGLSKRRISAELYDESGNLVKDHRLNYRIEIPVEGVTLEEGLLKISSNLKANGSVVIIAEDPEDTSLFASTTVELIKDNSLEDKTPNQLEKEGWKLFYNDEFNGASLDTSVWSEYYLRNWAKEDIDTKADYYFENGALVIKTDEGIKPWSHQDGQIAVKSIASFEKSHLHKFGSAHTSKIIPKFDGFATKYGYFETRLKMPNTKDGSHFAWWMIGVQDDQNITAQLAGKNTYQGHTSNQTGEFDIMEISLYNTKHWQPVIHPNGTTDYQYEHVPLTTIEGDPSNEFHIYGFEWDENGTKFYVDNELVKTSTRTPNYRMMTFFGVYSTGGMGKDRGIYPKEAIIDYFRVYKKDESSRPNSIILNNGETPNFIRVPDSGENKVQMFATVVDQFDQPLDVEVSWKLSKTVDGFTPMDSEGASVQGVTINNETGVITVESNASLNQNLFATAYVDNKVKATYHIRLSKDINRPERIIFDNTIETVTIGEPLQLSAKLYDQYKRIIEDATLTYQISQDITGSEIKSYNNVNITANGQLTVDDPNMVGKNIVVTAKSQGKSRSCVLKVIS